MSSAMSRERFMSSLNENEREIISEARRRERNAIYFWTLASIAPIGFWAWKSKFPLGRTLMAVTIGGSVGSGIGLFLGSMRAATYISSQPGGHVLMTKVQKAVIEERMQDLTPSQRSHIRKMQEESHHDPRESFPVGRSRSPLPGTQSSDTQPQQSAWEAVRQKVSGRSSKDLGDDATGSENSYFFNPDLPDPSDTGDKSESHDYAASSSNDGATRNGQDFRDRSQQNNGDYDRMYRPDTISSNDPSQEEFDRLVEAERQSSAGNDSSVYERESRHRFSGRDR